MTLEEVAAYLRLSKDTVYRMVHTGRIPASKAGTQWRFRKEDVDAWLEKNKNIIGNRSAFSLSPEPYSPVDKRLGDILEEYRVRLTEVLGENLEALVLYGSQVRGEADEGSDIDVLCVMKGPFDYGELIQETSEAAAEISLKHDVVLSTAFVSRADYERCSTPFLMNVRREGLPVWARSRP
jgi:excisionase family DNA binding protein